MWANKKNLEPRDGNIAFMTWVRNMEYLKSLLLRRYLLRTKTAMLEEYQPDTSPFVNPSLGEGTSLALLLSFFLCFTAKMLPKTKSTYMGDRA